MGEYTLDCMAAAVVCTADWLLLTGCCLGGLIIMRALTAPICVCCVLSCPVVSCFPFCLDLHLMGAFCVYACICVCVRVCVCERVQLMCVWDDVQFSASDPGFTLSAFGHSMLFAHNLAQNGSEDLKRKFLPGAVQGMQPCVWRIGRITSHN